jgi:hypothetical protein
MMLFINKFIYNPLPFIDEGNHMYVCKLKKYLYGSKQAARTQNDANGLNIF